MSIFEQYSMAIPIFTPSLDFLTNLHLKYSIVGGLNYCHYNEQTMRVPRHAAYNGTAKVRASLEEDNNYKYLDPRNEFAKNPQAARHWLSKADYYLFPHVIHFNSAEHLVDIMQTFSKNPSRLQAISIAMREINRSRLKSILRYWRSRLLDIAEYSPNFPE